MAEKSKLAYVGYVIDRGIPWSGVQKAVDFFDGVGILDYAAVSMIQPAWFEFNDKREIVAVNENAVTMKTFVDYWEGMGCKVTPIDEATAFEIRQALQSGKPIDPKYLKPLVDTRAVAGGVKPETKIPSSEPEKDGTIMAGRKKK